MSVAEYCRKLGISEQTYYRWKKKYGRLGVNEVRRLKHLEEENRKLKQLVADFWQRGSGQGDSAGCFAAKAPTPADMRRLVRTLQDTHGVSQKRMGFVLRKSRSSLRYEPMLPRKDAPLRMRIKEIAKTRLRYGYKRIHVLLKREGWNVDHKRVHRIYKQLV